MTRPGIEAIGVDGGAAPMILSLLLATVTTVKPNAAECLALGFGDSLLCSTCDVLNAATESAALDAECRSCCALERSDSSSTYDRIVLEMCE